MKKWILIILVLAAALAAAVFFKYKGDSQGPVVV
jgi:hypothetical protein